MTPRCPRCGSEMKDGGAAVLDQCAPPHVPARRFVCVSDRCEETVSTRPLVGPALALRAMRDLVSCLEALTPPAPPATKETPCAS